ncbi:MAG TPA: hypothetical protein VGI03_00510 [Verrucomicrobiae bacterium]
MKEIGAELKCNCAVCDGKIAFDPAQFVFSFQSGQKSWGQEIQCPHCGSQTRIYRVIIEPEKENPANKPPQPKDELTGLKIAGYITSIIFTPLGFIIGIILLAKNRVGKGIVCIALSLFCSAIYAGVIIGYVVWTNDRITKAEEQKNMYDLTNTAPTWDDVKEASDETYSNALDYAKWQEGEREASGDTNAEAEYKSDCDKAANDEYSYMTNFTATNQASQH